ncbi:ATP-binding protein [Paenibacillus barcinonensis]|uniref:ATP-binding protein n=1 Tax=Paenibacillus barcinonensis TaxID=198119 RepID=A0A2V4W533_PAEBA|nr:ATP-binding protein [Paenibacillus barcinonensis]PYE49776.1 putative DNA-binding protein [Paenibacillus barcinonensis]QKS56535.1 ATP-binding protein [Paenibacillus barcinonensis]
MVDTNEILQLLQSPDSKNLICRKLEFRPRNLAMFIAALSNLPEEYGYILIGVKKETDKYCIHGISPEFKISESINRALDLLSEQPLIDFERVTIEGNNIFAIKVKKVPISVFFKPAHLLQSQPELFIRDLYLACIKLQSRKLYVDATEDERNDFITDLLETNGYHLKDQTRRGSSAAGKSSGEVDIFINKNGMPFTIIEALNLDSLNTNYLNTHLNKIYSYDTTGNAFNICLSYVKVKDFGSFWDRYCAHVKGHEYPVMLISSDTSADNDYGYSDIRFMTTTHNRSGKLTHLYHMCVKIQGV